MFLKKLLAIGMTLTLSIIGYGQHPIPLDSSSFVATHNRPIVLQHRQTFSFTNGVSFSNQFKGARLNGITQINDSVFTILIIPENKPINNSPWYAFKVWSKAKKSIRVNLTYDHGSHRYHPKISKDKKHWSLLKKEHYHADTTAVYFKIDIAEDTLWLAAQPLMTSDDALEWSKAMSSKAAIVLDTIGFSTFGRPLWRLSPTKIKNKDKVIVISRQHPPETTGYMAMKTFVSTIWDDTKLAKSFRKKVDLIVYPMLNPDGVDLGHWRHNAGGVDLNRDWHFFRQPEIKAITDDIKKIIDMSGTRILFAGDFHSTWSDLFYTNENDSLAYYPDFIPRLLDHMERGLAGFKADLRPGGNLSPTSKSWFYNFLHASAVTYEVGDTTSYEIIDRRARAAAIGLMQLLLEN